jgi:hypothetical protein
MPLNILKLSLQKVSLRKRLEHHRSIVSFIMLDSLLSSIIIGVTLSKFGLRKEVVKLLSSKGASVEVARKDVRKIEKWRGYEKGVGVERG